MVSGLVGFAVAIFAAGCVAIVVVFHRDPSWALAVFSASLWALIGTLVCWDLAVLSRWLWQGCPGMMLQFDGEEYRILDATDTTITVDRPLKAPRATP